MGEMSHITTISNSSRGLAVAVLVLEAAALLAFVVMHLRESGVEHFARPLSEYAASGQVWLRRIGTFWLGLAALLAGVALADAIFPKPTLTILGLLIFAATAWAGLIFSADPSRKGGGADVVLAGAAFAAVAVAAAAFISETADDPFWAPDHGLLVVLGVLLPVVVVATELCRRIRPALFGLLERASYLGAFVWLAVVALALAGGQP